GRRRAPPEQRRPAGRATTAPVATATWARPPPRATAAASGPVRAADVADRRSPGRRPTMAGMADAPVHLSSGGPPETVLDDEPPEALAALAAALDRPEDERRVAVAAVVRPWPRLLDAWAAPGRLARHRAGRHGDDRA